MAYQTMQRYVICYQWFKQGLVTERLRYNLTQMIRPAWASNPDSSVTVARQRVPRRYQ